MYTFLRSISALIAYDKETVQSGYLSSLIEKNCELYNKTNQYTDMQREIGIAKYKQHLYVSLTKNSSDFQHPLILR